MNDKKIEEIKASFCTINEYKDIFEKLNKITFHNMSKASKIIKDFQTNKPNSSNYEIIKFLKTQILYMSLSLEEIIDTIKEFKENE